MLTNVGGFATRVMTHVGATMKKPILSLPIDKQLEQCLRRDMHDEQLSKADIVRRILRLHYGLVRKQLRNQIEAVP